MTARTGRQPAAARRRRTRGVPVDVTQTLAFRVLGLASRFTAQFAIYYTRRFGVGLPEWRTLALLGLHGPMPAARISDLAQVDRGLISRAIRDLEARRLVVRRRHPTDGRTQLVSLATKGMQLHDRIAAVVRQRQSYLLARLTPRERKGVERLLIALADALDDLGKRPPPRGTRPHPRRATKRA